MAGFYSPRRWLPVCLALFLFSSLSLAAYVFDGHRVAQFDRNGAGFGSRRTVMNHLATSVAWDVESSSSLYDLSRRVAAVPVSELTSDRLDELVGPRRAAGVMIVLPAESSLPSLTQAQLSAFVALEQHLLSKEFQVPIYFVFDEPQLQEMMSQLGPDAQARGTRYHLMTPGPEATEVSPLNSVNFQGWHHGAPNPLTEGADAESLPIIAVVANFDSFASAPTLAMGADANGSGVIAVLELARLFGRLYAEARTHGAYNLLFLLTAAGRLNYAGTKHWLNHVDARVLESLEFALCLDGLGSADKLFLHVSKPPKRPEIKQLYGTFERTAAEMSIDLEIVHKKINISAGHVDWHHERFARKKILTATLSNSAEPASLLTNGSIFDQKHKVDEKALARNIKFVAESLAKHIYGYPNRSLEVVSGSNSVNMEVVSAWHKFLTSQSRAEFLFHKKSDLLVQLEKTLSSHTSNVVKTSFSVTTDYKFYRHPAQRISAYQVKPLWFDVVVSLFIGLYFLIFYLAIQAPRSMKELKASLGFGSK